MSNLRQNNDYDQLRKAIKKKNKVKAQNLIRNNVDVNITDTRGDTLLHLTITQFEDLDIMKMLLDREANIHATNHNNEKPLDVAIQNNRTEVAILLIRKGALFGEDLNALLLKTIEKNNHTIFKNVIDNRTLNNRSINFRILFNAAISRGHAKILNEIRRHRRFLKPSDKYIPREAVIRTGQEYKECVQLLLKWNFTIDPFSNQDKDFVYGAVENGHLQIVIQLLKLGIDANMINLNTGLSLLKVACLNKHNKIVENLLKYNACLNMATLTNYGMLYDPPYNHHEYIHWVSTVYNKNNFCDVTCLHIAVLNSDPMMTKLLLRYDARIIDDPKFFYITCIAIRNNCEEIVRIFLDQGVNVNEIDPQGRSLLHFCVNTNGNGEEPRYNIVKLLLERGAIIHTQTLGNSLIFEAITNRHRKIAQLFLDYNANIQYISPDGDTLLHKAIENDFDIEFIKSLLIRNSRVDVVNNNMFTPLLVACKTQSNNQFEIIKTLLHYNANVNCPVNILLTPLRCASLVRNLTDSTVPLESRVNFVNVHDRGQTALHFVCKYKSDKTTSIIELLLKHNANIEAVDARGWTPLFVACENGNGIAVKCLLDHHANVNHTDLENLTPFYIAAKYSNSNSEVIILLLEHKVNVHCFDKQGNSIIHLIVENGNAELIPSLARTQINFNSINKKGDTPLHIAVRNGFVDVTENLIKYGANINVLDKDNCTSLQNVISRMSICRSKLDDYCDRQNFHYDRSRSWDNSDNEDYATDRYLNEINTYKQIIKILITQVVKLKTAGLKVNNLNSKIVYNSDDHSSSDDEFSDQDDIESINSSDGSINDDEFSDEDDMGCEIDILQLEVKCEQEIEKMRMKNIGFNNMTLYDLLKKNIRILSRFVKNKKIQQILEREVYDEKFPLYINIIRSRFRDAKFRYKLMKSAKRYFTSNICPQLSDDCINAVFSYLNIKEINMFIRAIKPLDS